MERARKAKTSIDAGPFQFRQSEALLRTVMENAAVGMILIGAGGHIIYANRAYATMVGREPADCIGLRVTDLVYKDDSVEAIAQLDSLRRGDIRGYRTERRYVRKDGTLVWGLTSAHMLRDEATGAPLYLIVQVTDIERQKAAEEAVRISESRWNKALESAGQGVWDHDHRTGRVFYSRMWHRMRGIPDGEEVVGDMEVWLQRVHPDDRDRIRDIVIKQDLGAVPRNDFEYREKHRDGRYLWILSRGGPVEWDADGNPTRFVGTDTDITALKSVVAALGAERERLRITLQAIGDGVISTDAEGRVAFLNPIAEQMTGWTSAEAVGRPVEEVFIVADETTGARLKSPVTEALRGQQPYYLDEDAVLVSRTGERRAVRDSAAPVRTSEGELLGAVLVFQDVTNSRELQKELAHSAMHDGLTGLANRGAFERALTQAVDQAHHERREHALCFVDLDRFKLVNDTAGHAAGDALLQQIAHAIRRACRSQDFLARIGGDEFALLLADCTAAGASKVAQQVIDAVAGVRFAWHGTTYEVGASAGITLVTQESPHITELMSQADAACYAAKHAGRNRVVIYDPSRHGPERLAEIA